MCSCGGSDIFHSIEFALKFGNKLGREVVKDSQSININTNTAITEITLPKEEMVFQAKRASG